MGSARAMHSEIAHRETWRGGGARANEFAPGGLWATKPVCTGWESAGGVNPKERRFPQHLGNLCHAIIHHSHCSILPACEIRVPGAVMDPAILFCRY